MQPFPVYVVADEARCFHCGSAELSLATESGNPPGRGRWRKVCRRCGRVTYFDLKEVPDAT